jgi:DNA-binding response OmpR family regulator
MKILIVEDENILAKVLEEKFKNVDFEVELVYDGEKALPAVKDFNPDIILLDLILPKKSGFVVLEELRADPELKMIPVIVLSNLGQEEDVKKALELGAKDYMVKIHHPIKEVVEKVKNLIFTKSR